MRIIILLLISVSCFAQVTPIKKTLTTNGNTIQYWEFPKQTSTKMPVIIFMHGIGAKGNVNDVLKEGLPLELVKGMDIPFIVAAPWSFSGWFDSKIYIQPLVDYYSHLPNVDPERIYLTGLSMGADGSWDASYRGSIAMVKAIAPVSGKGDYNGGKATQQRGIKAWGIHGSSDNAVPISDGKRPINGMISIGGTPTWTLIPGAHDARCWDVAFSLTDRAELGGTTIYKWFLSLVKPKPEEIPGLYLDGQFCGTDSCRVDNHLVTIKK